MDFVDGLNSIPNSQALLTGLRLFSQVLIFVICFRLMAILTNDFITPALECLSLRSGGLSHTAVYVLHSAIGSLPETFLSITAALNGHSTLHHTLPVGTILGCGWISMTIIPALVSLNRCAEIPYVIIIREIGLYGLMCAFLLYKLADWNTSPVFYSSMLLVLYLVYFNSVRATQSIEQRMSRQKRERRLINQLQPIGTFMLDGDQLERAPIELALSRAGIVGNYNYVSIEGALRGMAPVGELGLSPNECGRLPTGSEKTLGFWLLSWFCFRALPGTGSERFYLFSVVNALLIHLLLSVLVTTICNSWADKMLYGLSNRLVGPIIVAGFSLLGETLKITTIPTDESASHFIIGGLSAQVFGLGVGLGLPWLLYGVTNGSSILDHPSVRDQLKISLVCACALMIYSTKNLDDEGLVRFHRCWPLFLLYLIAVLVFIFSQ